MKIVALLGSPRPESNSASLAQAFLDSCRGRGADIKTYVLNKMSYQGCQACMGCKTKAESCILKDDLTPVYEEIRQADVVLLASPVYFGDFSGQLKSAYDRFYACLNPDFSSRLPAGKQAIFVLTQGNPDPEQFKDIFKRYETFMKWLNFDACHLLRACGLQGPGEVKDRPEALREAADLAGTIMAGAS
jgi:multimeric flavodoxin WrbA